MVLMGYSGARGTLIYEKILCRKSRVRIPFLTDTMADLAVRYTLCGRYTLCPHCKWYGLDKSILSGDEYFLKGPKNQNRTF
jgi:hypothetical protein